MHVRGIILICRNFICCYFWLGRLYKFQLFSIYGLFLALHVGSTSFRPFYILMHHFYSKLMRFFSNYIGWFSNSGDCPCLTDISTPLKDCITKEAFTIDNQNNLHNNSTFLQWSTTPKKLFVSIIVCLSLQYT